MKIQGEVCENLRINMWYCLLTCTKKFLCFGDSYISGFSLFLFDEHVRTDKISSCVLVSFIWNVNE